MLCSAAINATLLASGWRTTAALPFQAPQSLRGFLRAYAVRGVPTEIGAPYENATNRAHYNAAINRQYIGAKITPVGSDEATLEMSVGADGAKFANSFGTMQGGVITILHDLVASQVALSHEKVGVHSMMSVQFYQAIPLAEGTLVQGHAKAVRIGKVIAGVHSSISVGGVLASTAQHDFVLKSITPKPH